jgi:hypothetical protein
MRKRPLPRRRRAVSWAQITLLLALYLGVSSGEGRRREFEEPSEKPSEEGAMPFYNPEAQTARSPLEDALERSQARLRTIEGVVGVAVGRTEIGDDALLIYVIDSSIRERVPSEIDGYPVEVVVVPGGFDALATS